MRPDRLSATDLAVLWPEDRGWPLDIGLVAVLDGETLFDDGTLRIDQIRQHVHDRLGLVPARFRKVLVRPRFGLGRPYWVDAPPLDVAAHVRAVELEPGATDSELLAACEQLRRRRFDTDRPRWMMWLLTGLPDQRVALYLNVHHCLVDGVAGVAALGAFVDFDGPVTSPTIAMVPARPPTVAELLADVVAGWLERLVAGVGSLRHPATAWTRVADDVRGWRRVAAEKVPSVSLNSRTVGPERRFAVVRSTLEGFKDVGHSHGATVNDVLLCVLAGGFRDLLMARGEHVDGQLLRAMVPVSLHSDGGGPVEGNSDAGLLLALPVGEPDPVVRLRQIAEDSTEQKRSGIVPGATSGMFSAPLLQRLLLRLTPRQRMSNTYVANVPGPPLALSMAGAPILELFPIVPILGNLTIGVGALSYDGQFNITVVADNGGADDLDVFVKGVQKAIHTLVGTGPAPRKRYRLSTLIEDGVDRREPTLRVRP